MVSYERRFRDDALSFGLPGDWCALECAIFGYYQALSTVYDWRPITIFMDCLPVVEMLGVLGSHRQNAILANLFSPVLDGVREVTLVWVPGHMGIRGNVVAE